MERFEDNLASIDDRYGQQPTTPLEIQHETRATAEDASSQDAGQEDFPSYSNRFEARRTPEQNRMIDIFVRRPDIHGYLATTLTDPTAVGRVMFFLSQKAGENPSTGQYKDPVAGRQLESCRKVLRACNYEDRSPMLSRRAFAPKDPGTDFAADFRPHRGEHGEYKLSGRAFNEAPPDMTGKWSEVRFEDKEVLDENGKMVKKKFMAVSTSRAQIEKIASKKVSKDSPASVRLTAADRSLEDSVEDFQYAMRAIQSNGVNGDTPREIYKEVDADTVAKLEGWLERQVERGSVEAADALEKLRAGTGDAISRKTLEDANLNVGFMEYTLKMHELLEHKQAVYIHGWSGKDVGKMLAPENARDGAYSVLDFYGLGGNLDSYFDNIQGSETPHTFDHATKQLFNELNSDGFFAGGAERRLEGWSMGGWMMVKIGVEMMEHLENKFGPLSREKLQQLKKEGKLPNLTIIADAPCVPDSDTFLRNIKENSLGETVRSVATGTTIKVGNLSSKGTNALKNIGRPAQKIAETVEGKVIDPTATLVSDFLLNNPDGEYNTGRPGEEGQNDEGNEEYHKLKTYVKEVHARNYKDPAVAVQTEMILSAKDLKTHQIELLAMSQEFVKWVVRGGEHDTLTHQRRIEEVFGEYATYGFKPLMQRFNLEGHDLEISDKARELPRGTLDSMDSVTFNQVNVLLQERSESPNTSDYDKEVDSRLKDMCKNNPEEYQRARKVYKYFADDSTAPDRRRRMTRVTDIIDFKQLVLEKAA